MNDGSEEWVPLKNLKESNPLQVAEYAIANNIVDKPVFKWWVPTAIKRRNRILSKVKTRYWQTTHKFGIKLSKTVKEALLIDKENGNTFWTDAIKLEMTNVRPAFRKWEDGDLQDALGGKKLVGYQRIRCHLIFDIKMDGKFTRKSSFCSRRAHY